MWPRGRGRDGQHEGNEGKAYDAPRRCRHAVTVERGVCSNVDVKTLWRVVALLALLLAPVAVSVHAPAPNFSAPVAACSEHQLRHDAGGSQAQYTWDQVHWYGCEGLYSFAWVLVAYRGHPVFDVTLVLKWSLTQRRWREADRGAACVPGVMPNFIYRQGCFSN